MRLIICIHIEPGESGTRARRTRDTAPAIATLKGPGIFRVRSARRLTDDAPLLDAGGQR